MNSENNPAVSVIIPVYNAEKYLRQCLDSVCSQTLRNIEIICVDDGSSDSSPAILAGYAGQDPRFKLITQENSGPGTARNNGVRNARGDYLAFIDSDDFWDPELLEKALAQAEKYGADICLYPFAVYDESTASAADSGYSVWMPAEKCFSPLEVRDRIFQMTPPAPGFRLYKRDLVERHGISFLPQYLAEDMHFVYPAMAFAERICYISDIHAFLRRGTSGNISSALWKYPKDTHRSLLQIRSILQASGKYEPFRDSFRTAAISASEYVFWHVPLENLPEKDRLEMLEELDIADKRSIIAYHGDDTAPGSFSRIRNLIHLIRTFGPRYTFRYIAQALANKKRPG